MTRACDFIDAALRYEASDDRAARGRSRATSDLRFYGASVGAVRGTIRDARRRYPDLTRDELAALSTELWAVPVFERRLAAIVLLQSMLADLDNTDLTRIESFLRSAIEPGLADPLTTDVVVPLVCSLQPDQRLRADRILSRWSADPDPALTGVAEHLARRRP